MKAWIELCFTKPIIKRASITALIVGTILVAINHGDAILHDQINLDRLFKIVLTVFVPYIVSTISSASTIMSIRQEKGNK
jgi:hypothetical protein